MLNQAIIFLLILLIFGIVLIIFMLIKNRPATSGQANERLAAMMERLTQLAEQNRE